MRVKKDKIDLDYNKTKKFFNHRSGKYSKSNPYIVTMYQDNHPELAIKFDKFEKEKLLPLFNLESNSKVLDLACGVGRWADVASVGVDKYLGVDFSEELIKIASSRVQGNNVSFRTGSATNLPAVLLPDERFNRILIVGLLMYLNDKDVFELTKQLSYYCEPETIICIREPIGISERFTLRDFFSNELNDTYHAIYRTRDELVDIFKQTLLQEGFEIVKEDYLFHDDSLNNRSETAKYYFILKRSSEK